MTLGTRIQKIESAVSPGGICLVFVPDGKTLEEAIAALPVKPGPKDCVVAIGPAELKL